MLRVPSQKCTQITEKTFRPDDDAQLVNRIVRHLKRHKLTIKFPKLDRKSLHIRAYADASHAGNMDLSSQLGIVVTLCDKNNQCSVIGYKSYKCRRITRSAIASECHALADAFDYAFMLKHDLEVLLQQPIPIQMLTDSKGLFDVIVKAGKTAERRLMIDIAACRQAYERHEIGDIAFTRSEYNLADCMTKIMHPAQLMNVMRTAHLEHPVEQWIIRNIS